MAKTNTAHFLNNPAMKMIQISSLSVTKCYPLDRLEPPLHASFLLHKLSLTQLGVVAQHLKRNSPLGREKATEKLDQVLRMPKGGLDWTTHTQAYPSGRVRQ